MDSRVDWKIIELEKGIGRVTIQSRSGLTTSIPWPAHMAWPDVNTKIYVVTEGYGFDALRCVHTLDGDLIYEVKVDHTAHKYVKQEPTANDILNLEFDNDDTGTRMTIRQWFVLMMQTLWREQEGFSGKRPLGNSGWDYYPAPEMIKKGWVKGKLDSDGYVEEMDDKAYDDLMERAVAAL